MKTRILIVLLCFGSLVYGQTKNEKEERVKKNTFPEKALKVIEQLPMNCKRLRFYKETDGQKQSFEVKFKYNSKRYSLEFSTDGNIEDLEVIAKFKTIEDSIKSKVNSYFQSTFTKHKLIKVQKQYLYNSEFDPTKFLSDILSQNWNKPPGFEIIAEVKAKKTRTVREFTFDQTGLFKSFRILNPTSYEHVLY